MKILSITAGAAEMYCGSCLRDNALASALMRKGHQVNLLPVYTPTVTDEANVSAGRPVLFGGISIYLQQHFSIFRHTPWLLDKIWDSPSVIKRFAAKSIEVDPRMLGALTVSSLKGEGGYQRKEIAKLVDFLAGEPRPDVANLPNSLLIALAAPIRRALNCPVVVTLQGEDLFLEGLPAPYKTEALTLVRTQVKEADLFVAVSEYYAGFMSQYLGIPPGQICTVPLGVNTEDLTPANDTSRTAARPFTIGYLARVAPEKGLHNLVDAYRILRHERGLPASRLAVAGYLAPAHRDYLATLEKKLDGWGLANEFKYVGAVDRRTKVQFLRDLDVFSVPTDYHESKGLFLLEAMACGVPVVEPNHGALPEMIRRTDGGVITASQQPSDIADAILALYRDRDRAATLGRQGAAGVRAHYTIERMADRMIEVYEEATQTSSRPTTSAASQSSHQDLSVAGR
jgi:glycosyltransferase involved in cell wall biosynthesis